MDISFLPRHSPDDEESLEFKNNVSGGDNGINGIGGGGRYCSW